MYLSHFFSSSKPVMLALAVVGLFSLGTSSTPVDHRREAVVAAKMIPSAAPPSRQTEDLCGPHNRPSTSDPLPAEEALRKKVELLQSGLAFLESRGSYSAQMAKQEVVGGELLPEHIISLKCRQQPFSVYLLWQTGDPGREVLYIEGENQGRLIGHDGGWKARLPALSLSPNSGLAMRDSRYPVTNAGLGGLIDLMIGVHRTDLQLASYTTCDYEPHVAFDGRDCQAFTTVYKDPKSSPQYRKSVTLIDREWNVPLSSQHYEWPRPGLDRSGDEFDAATLIESYQFTDVDFDRPLTDADFDRQNDNYAFR